MPSWLSSLAFFSLSKCNYIVWCSFIFFFARDFCSVYQFIWSVISRAKSNLAMKLLRSTLNVEPPFVRLRAYTHTQKRERIFELRLNKELIFGTKAMRLNWRTPPHKTKIITPKNINTQTTNQTEFYLEILSVLFGLLSQLNLKAFSIDTENENGIEKEIDGLIRKSRIYFSSFGRQTDGKRRGWWYFRELWPRLTDLI